MVLLITTHDVCMKSSVFSLILAISGTICALPVQYLISRNFFRAKKVEDFRQYLISSNFSEKKGRKFQAILI